MKEDREALAALEGKHLGQMSRYYKTTEISGGRVKQSKS